VLLLKKLNRPMVCYSCCERCWFVESTLGCCTLLVRFSGNVERGMRSCIAVNVVVLRG